MLEAILNKDFKDKITAKSSGVQASGQVHPYTKKVLAHFGYWDERYYSKRLGEVLDGKHSFDLVITVCHHAQERCPIFPENTKVLHVGFDDPVRYGYDGFVKLFENMKKIFHKKYFDD
jgi:arsenate reductase